MYAAKNGQQTYNLLSERDFIRRRRMRRQLARAFNLFLVRIVAYDVTVPRCGRRYNTQAKRVANSDELIRIVPC